jgi:hypothetical protein
MATRDLPCAGCGELMWRVAKSLPPGEAMCRPCRREGRPLLSCAACGKSMLATPTSARPGQAMCFPCRRARNPRHAPCAQCRKPITLTRNSAPPGQAMCRPCRTVTVIPRRAAQDCPVCGTEFTPKLKSSGEWTKTCSRSCGNYHRLGKTGLSPSELRPEGMSQVEWNRARARRKTYRRQQRTQTSDVTLAYEATLRRKARICPLCSVRLTAKPYLPSSKELDHIVPLCIGGTHTVGNVRIICRRCNRARPLDGSDITGQLTLWAQVDGVVATHVAKVAASRTCDCGRQKVKAPNGRLRCYECQPLWRDGLTTDERAERARRAADLRRHTDLSWQAIATRLGYSSGQAAYAAAVHRARADGEYDFGRYAVASSQVSA